MSGEPIEDDLELLQGELAALGLARPPRPEDAGLAFRSAESFTHADARPRSRARRWIPGVLVAAAVAVLVAVLLRPEGQDKAPVQTSPTVAPATPSPVTVAAVVRQAAQVSAAQPDLSQTPYWRVRSYQQQGDAPREERIVWLGNGRPGLVLDDFGRADLSPATFGLQESSLTWDELVSLPADPVALRELLDREARGLSAPRLAVVKMAAELLAESPAPPAVREALWQVIAGVPGVTSAGQVRDALGRVGIGLSLNTPGRGRLEYIIDPAAGTILQSMIFPTKPGADRFVATYVEQGPAASLPPQART